jgi:hypothetical protein
MKTSIAVAAILLTGLASSDRAISSTVDSWKALSFLEGTWDAQTRAGSAHAQGSSTYTFSPQLNHHVLVRQSASPAACKGPASFNCEHSDLLYIYAETDNQPLKAIYFDNEGHVIHYEVSSPNSTTAILTSAASPSAPQFRLIYELKDMLMSGKFQIREPGQREWNSYLEWSGAKK